MKKLLIPVVVSFLSLQSVIGSPYISHITKTAKPGEVIGIHGDQFGNDADVWIDHLELGDRMLNREKKVTLLSKSENFLSFKVPESMQKGVYGIIVRSGSKDSNAAWVNRAEAWHCLDLAGTEITPGFVFRIAGRNLAFDGKTPKVRFVRKTDGMIWTATNVVSVKRSEVIQCKAPTYIQPGERYYVEVNNGMADISTSWTRMPGELLVRADGNDPFQLGVPWASDFAFIGTRVVNVKGIGFYAAGNGVTDDRIPIQRAIDLLSAAGGGVVYLPAGTYAISSAPIQGVNYGLVLRSNVVLMGDGAGQTTIVGAGLPTGYDGGLICAPPAITSKIGLKGLTIKSGNWTTMTMNFMVANRSFIVGCRLESSGVAGSRVLAWREGSMSVFKDSQFVTQVAKGNAPYFVRQKDFLIQNCQFEFTDDRMDFVQGERVQIENCKIVRSVFTDGQASPEYGGLVAPSKDFTMMNSEFSKSGNGNIPQANDGESVLCEHPSGHFALSKVTGATTTTLTDSTAQWTPNAAVGSYVSIIRGPGVGQKRLITANTNNKMTVDSAWNIQPVAGQSVFSVNERHGRHLITDCRFVDVPRGIWYYRTAIDDVVITNNSFVDTGYPILVRGSQRMDPEIYSGGKEFNAMSGILIEGNSVSQTNTYSYPEPTAVVLDVVVNSGTEVMGNFYYDTVIRNNVMRSTGSRAGWGLYLSSSHGPLIDNHNCSLVGVIAQKNWFENFNTGININTGNKQAILSGNVFVNVIYTIVDHTLSYHIRASAGTVVNE